MNTRLTCVALTGLALVWPRASARADSRQWDGGAQMDNHWTNPDNWAGNVAPNPGDYLLFQTGQSHPDNNNDYPNGTTFDAIELRGGPPPLHGYNISGNTIALNAGLRVENNTGQAIEHTVGVPFLLNSNQTFTIINDLGILYLNGGINLNGKELTFDVATSSLAQSQGVISGAGSLIKTNTGTLILLSTNTYTGSTTLDGGTLQINGSQPASPLLLYAGTLTGKGTVGTITAVGSGGPGSILLSPGASPGILTCSNLALNASTTLAVELNGATPGSGYDQLSVSGSVALNDATLSVALGFTPAIGSSFVIINNDGGDAVSGTFNGLPEGAFLTVINAMFRITYAGSDGNDVVLTRVNPPAQFTSITKLGNSSIQLQGAGLSNLSYTIQAATNLIPIIAWSDLGTALADGSGQFSFTDTNAALFPKRFYRALSP